LDAGLLLEAGLAFEVGLAFVAGALAAGLAFDAEDAAFLGFAAGFLAPVTAFLTAPFLAVVGFLAAGFFTLAAFFEVAGAFLAWAVFFAAEVYFLVAEGVGLVAVEEAGVRLVLTAAAFLAGARAVDAFFVVAGLVALAEDFLTTGVAFSLAASARTLGASLTLPEDPLGRTNMPFSLPEVMARLS